jgi:Flp pilus assembly protein TadD/TolB-like protein
LKHILQIALVLWLSCALGAVTAGAPPSQTLIILPFENASKAPGLEWIGEAFPEVLGQRMGSPSLYVISREDRIYAFDRMGVPSHLRPSRATLFSVAEQMDADYMVVGSYTFDGQAFTATAQLLDMKRLHLSREVRQSGPLPKLLEIQNSLAWDLLRLVRPGSEMSREAFLASSPSIRLDAFENYIRGTMASTRQDKVRYFREAARLNPSYTLAIFQLGKTYFAEREYESAASWFARVPRQEAVAREANFFLGLSAYYAGQFERAAAAFSFLASRLPLTEVYNNWGVVESRRGRRDAVEHFTKATQADPSDADYHFNLGVALYRHGDPGHATHQLREALRLRPSDAEAKSLLEAISSTAGANRHPDAAALRIPLERIKRNYDETSFRQLALEIQNATELRLSKTDPHTHAAYHVEHGRQLLGQGFASEATQEFREAIWLDPTNAGAHSGLAVALEQSNDAATARSEARAAIGLHPTAEAYLVLARLDLRDNNYQAAADNLNQALTLEPANAVAQNLRQTVAAKLVPKTETRAK